MYKLFRKTIISFLLVIFVSTLILNVFSLYYSPLNYFDNFYKNNVISKGNDLIPGYHSRLRDLDQLENLINTEQQNFSVETTTSIIYESLIHGGRDILIFENWFLWLLSNFYKPLKKTQNIKRIVASGIANCNEANAVLNEIALTNNVPARFISLDGHIISELKINNKWIMVDADFGIVFPFGYDKISDDNIPYVRETLRGLLIERGFSLDTKKLDERTIKEYEEILLSTQNNTIHQIGAAISPRLKIVEIFGEIMNWGLTFLFGIALIFFNQKKKFNKDKL